MDKRSLIFVFGLTIALYFVNQHFSSKDEERAQMRRQEEARNKQTMEVQKQIPIAPETFSAEETPKAESFYVLENNFQQLVFSNVGGAIVEINLPLQSKTNPEGVIRPIGVDKTLAKDFPNDDRFPENSYETPNREKATGTVGGYYPLLRRNIPKKSKVDPRYYAFNVIGDVIEPNLLYTLKRYEKNLIEFEGVTSNKRIVKTYSFPENSPNAPYCFDLSVKVEGDARGLSLTTGVPEVELISGNAAPALKYRIKRGKSPHVELIDLPKTSSSFTSIQPDWVCNSNGFFGIILDPLSEIGGGFNVSLVPGIKMPTRLTLIDAEYDLYPAEKYPGYDISLYLPSSPQTTQFRVFAGPLVSDVLEKVDATYSNSAIGYNPDYKGAQSFHGWFAFISEPFAKFLMLLMKFFYFVTHSWGFSIILLTAALRVMLYPLNAWSIKSTAKMQQVAPQVAAIQERNKKEPKKAQMEIMNLYREKGVNPITGCFPILIQMPFLIGMFDLLKSTFELRGASFIPGWIDNLTAPDVLFSWNYPVIFFGTNFHLLPILLGAVMYFQQKMSSTAPKDPKNLTDQQKQQKMMGNIMTIVFAVMFYHFPSGLNLYWLSSMALGILQQWWMTRKLVKNVEIIVPPKKK